MRNLLFHSVALFTLSGVLASCASGASPQPRPSSEELAAALKPRLRKSMQFNFPSLKKDFPIHIYFADETTGAEPREVIIYVRNRAWERIGQEGDLSILKDYIERKFIVMTLDFGEDQRRLSLDRRRHQSGLPGRIRVSDAVRPSGRQAGAQGRPLLHPAGGIPRRHRPDLLGDRQARCLWHARVHHEDLQRGDRPEGARDEARPEAFRYGGPQRQAFRLPNPDGHRLSVSGKEEVPRLRVLGHGGRPRHAPPIPVPDARVRVRRHGPLLQSLRVALRGYRPVHSRSLERPGLLYRRHAVPLQVRRSVQHQHGPHRDDGALQGPVRRHAAVRPQQRAHQGGAYVQ